MTMATIEDGVRVFELTEVNSFDNDDYLLIDKLSNTEAKKIKAKRLGITYTVTVDADGGGFTFAGDNGYSQYVAIPKDAEMSYDDYEDLTEEQKMDDSNRFIPDYPSEEREPEFWTKLGRDALDTEQKTVSKAINELDATDKSFVGADKYDDSKTYPTYSEWCIKDDVIYKFTGTGTTSGDWDSTKWTATDIKTEISQLNASLVNFKKYHVVNVTATTTTNSYVTPFGAYVNQNLTAEQLALGTPISATVVSDNTTNPCCCMFNANLRAINVWSRAGATFTIKVVLEEQ